MSTSEANSAGPQTLLKKTTQRRYWGSSLAVQWSGLHTLTAEGPGSIPGWGTKILHSASTTGTTKTFFFWQNKNISGPKDQAPLAMSPLLLQLPFYPCSDLVSLLRVSKDRSVVLDSLPSHEQYSPWNSPDQNTGVGSLSLLQGIFLTQGSNSGLPHCRRILYQLSYQGSPSIARL